MKDMLRILSLEAGLPKKIKTKLCIWFIFMIDVCFY